MTIPANRPAKSPHENVSPNSSIFPDSPGGFPSDGRLVTSKSSKKMDRMVSVLLTMLGIAAIFLVLVVLLKNISPNSPTSLAPHPSQITENEEEVMQQGIAGD